MYVKIHDTIFGSSIMEKDIETRYIWFCMLTIADQNGYIDETIPALARRFNVSEDILKKAIECFCAPDPNSRSKENEGRKLCKLHETFGWKVINYEKYRNIKNYEDRKQYMRRYMRDYRKNKDSVNFVNSCKPVSPSEAEAETNNIYIGAKMVLSYMNEIGNRKFTPIKANLEMIQARLKEGHTPEECKQVIDTKWADKDFDKKYFRPTTLFRPSKFEGYLNEKSRERYC